MSADNITTCPECHEPELREYIGIAMDQRRRAVVIEYEAICNHCSFSFKMPELHVQVPRKAM